MADEPKSETENKESVKPAISPERARRLFWIKVFSLGFFAVIGLIILELGIRLAMPQYHPGRQIAFYLEPDGTPLGPKGQTVVQRTPKGDYDLTISFNELGLRDERMIGDAKAGDWVLIGDSFSLGWGVETKERFGDVLASQLGQPVYNVAIPTDFRGYEKLLNLAHREGAAVSNLVVGICMENDLADYATVSTNTAPPKVGLLRRVRFFGKANSALYLCLSNELQKIGFIRSILESLGIARSFDHPELLNLNRVSDADIKSSVEALRPLLAPGRRVMFLIIPARGLWIGENIEREQEIHDQFVAGLKALSTNVVDMRVEFEATKDPTQFYFQTDPHWNA
ncbi:MAG: hypothetical protein ACPGVU_25075, partial [Limisphaerales bacterium]